MSQILRIARAGNLARALRLFRELGLDERKGDPKALTLKGRLLKDLARRAHGEERARLYSEASDAYLSANALKRDSYPLINAAALACFAGDGARARSLATDVLQLIESDPNEGETVYWREATRSEALLLLKRHDEAEASLAQAIVKLPRAYEDHAATLGQFELIVAQQGADPDWLERYRPPASLHFSGAIGIDENETGLKDKIADTLATLRPGFGFGALAAGADIIIAEMLAEAGAALHVHLPDEPSVFRDASVAPFGSEWIQRFDQLTNHADTITIVEPALSETPRPFEDAIDLANLNAMGQCLRQASILRSRAGFLTVSARAEPLRPSLQICRDAGHTLIRVEATRIAGHPRAQPASEEALLNLKCVLASSGMTTEARTSAAGLGLYVVERGELTLLRGDFKVGLDWLMHNGQSVVTEGASLLLDSTDNTSILEERVAQLSEAAEPGQCLTDRLSASVASVLRPTALPEEMGEVRTLYGPVSLWAIPI